MNNKIDFDHLLKHEQIFQVGVVHSVSGRKIRVKVFKNKNHPFLIYDGEITKNVGTGSYIKIVKGLTVVIGKIEGEEIDEENYYNREYNKQETKIRRFLNVSLLGHYEKGRFYQGIKELPLIGNECYALEKDDFEKLHNFADKDEETITIGKLSDDTTFDINVGVNKLFASHIGIFGNTGSGKSNTLTRIYMELFTKAEEEFDNFEENSNFIFIDFNGEYVKQKVLSENKTIINLTTRKVITAIKSTDKYPLPSSIISNTEMLSVLLNASEMTQKPFLKSALSSKFLQDPSNYSKSVILTTEKIITSENPSGDKEDIINLLLKICPFLDPTSVSLVEDLIHNLKIHLGKIPKGSWTWDGSYTVNKKWEEDINPLLKTISFQEDLDPVKILELKIYLHFYHKISVAGVKAEYVQHLINRVKGRLEDLSKLITLDDAIKTKHITILSLRNVNIEMKKVIPLIVCKYLYEEQKKVNDEKEKIQSSLNIVIDEAHNILSTESERENEDWKQYRLETFEEIIKEGRKFGTFLTIASQRPYDISQTIISQLHNYFIHRLINNNDLNAVRRAVAYLDDLSFDTIPILSVGSCFFAGLAIDIPVKLNIEYIDEEDRRPKSDTVKLTEAWTTPKEV
ncbi:ATP-binding protein [Candidatus Woesebacteria bacterium]|nr:ATP-binding protein [Candidatus Woesebacteria bacterium]